MFNFKKSSDASLFFADGYGPMQKWDGVTHAASTVGVKAPGQVTNAVGVLQPTNTAALQLSSSGIGAIVGTYYAYTRFVDKDGNYSNLSPISAAFAPAGTTYAVGTPGVTITNITVKNNSTGTTAFIITAQNHGFPMKSLKRVSFVGVKSTDSSLGKQYLSGPYFVTPTSADAFAVIAPGTDGTTFTLGSTYTSCVPNDVFTYTGGATYIVMDLSAAASNTAPIVITSAGHGLTTGNVVKVSGVQGNDAANGTWVVTVVDSDNFSLNDSAGSDDYTGGGTWTAGVGTITYSNIPLPIESKVVKRQILRNTDGQARTFYVDIDTTDLTSTTLSSTNDDTTLATKTAVPLLDVYGNALANRYGLPPDFKRALANHGGRMYALVDRVVQEGHVSVTFGSTTVTGVSTQWFSNYVGRFLYVTGGDAGYEIQSLDASTQTITLIKAYQGPTDLFAQYAIRPAPAYRKLVYYSEPNLPEAWPAVNGLALPEDDDEITGGMTMMSYLFVLERNHMYRFTAGSNPATDGAVFLAEQRGCVNQRCFVVAEDVGFLLDSQGIHSFDGGQSTPISQAVQDLFRPGPSQTLQINWAASEYFHCCHFPVQDTIRWFVSLDGSPYPKHAMAYSYRHKRWWIESFPWYIFSSCAWPGTQPGMLLGTEGGRVMAFWQSSLDGANPTAGTVRSTVTSATLTTLTDTAATFDSSVINAPLAIVAGTGKGQVRNIASYVGTTLTLVQPWNVKPDMTSTYQIGGVQWDYRTGWFRWVITEEEEQRRLEVIFQPNVSACTMDMRIFTDFSAATAWVSGYTSGDNDGVAVTRGSSDLVANLAKNNGLVQQRLPNGKELYVKGGRFVSVELTGFTNQDPVRIYQLMLDGVEQG
jgi:hypothetical protein